jgi:hypothetical protein
MIVEPGSIGGTAAGQSMEHREVVGAEDEVELLGQDVAEGLVRPHLPTENSLSRLMGLRGSGSPFMPIARACRPRAETSRRMR